MKDIPVNTYIRIDWKNKDVSLYRVIEAINTGEKKLLNNDTGKFFSCVFLTPTFFLESLQVTKDDQVWIKLPGESQFIKAEDFFKEKKSLKAGDILKIGDNSFTFFRTDISDFLVILKGNSALRTFLKENGKIYLDDVKLTLTHLGYPENSEVKIYQEGKGYPISDFLS